MTRRNGKLAVSVDVEDWYHHLMVTGAPYSEYDTVDEFFENWSGRYDYVTRPVERVLNLLDDFGITATFFVVADLVDNSPGLVEKIATRGHSVECHGLHHACALDPSTKEPRFGEREYATRLRTAKEKLEAASGQDVTGFRAPNAYVSGWMLDVLEEVGFEYDSSVSHNSLYNKTDSPLTGVGTTPYQPGRGTLVPGGDHGVVEFPWPYWEFSGYRIPTAGGSLVRLFGRRIIQRGLEQSLKRGHSVFYFHPLDIGRESLPSAGNSFRRPGYWAFKGKRAEERIRTILSDFDSDVIVTHDELLKNPEATIV